MSSDTEITCNIPHGFCIFKVLGKDNDGCDYKAFCDYKAPRDSRLDKTWSTG